MSQLKRITLVCGDNEKVGNWQIINTIRVADLHYLFGREPDQEEMEEFANAVKEQIEKCWGLILEDAFVEM